MDTLPGGLMAQHQNATLNNNEQAAKASSGHALRRSMQSPLGALF